MLRSLGFAIIVGVAVVLASCGTSGTDTRQEEAGTTTSSVATETTAELTTTSTVAAAVTTTIEVPSDETGRQLAGDWFACEFVETPGEAPTDNCATFDDDGLRFDPEGLLVIIERVGGTERNCLFDNPGRCFESELEEIEIQGELLGGWALDGTTIAVGTADCDGTVEWEPGDNHSIFRPGDANGCEVLELDSNAREQAQAGGVYFGRYEGRVNIVDA